MLLNRDNESSKEAVNSSRARARPQSAVPTASSANFSSSRLTPRPFPFCERGDELVCQQLVTFPKHLRGEHDAPIVSITRSPLRPQTIPYHTELSVSPRIFCQPASLVLPLPTGDSTRRHASCFANMWVFETATRSELLSHVRCNFRAKV